MAGSVVIVADVRVEEIAYARWVGVGGVGEGGEEGFVGIGGGGGVAVVGRDDGVGVGWEIGGCHAGPPVLRPKAGDDRGRQRARGCDCC